MCFASRRWRSPDGAPDDSLKPENKFYFFISFSRRGFGRRSNGYELRHSILIAQAVRRSTPRPLQLLWSREQDMRASRVRPQSGGAM